MSKIVDSEIRRALEGVKSANGALRKQPNRNHQEMVCIETRAAYATFEDISCWSGSVDSVAQQEMIKAFRESDRLLNKSSAHDCVCRAVAERLRELEEFNLEAIMVRIDD